MIVATAAAAICAFLIAFHYFRVVPIAARALAITREAWGVMRDPAFDDAARERAVRAASLRLFGTFFSILARGLLALAVSLLPIWLADASGLAARERTIDFLSRWDVILISSVVIVLGYIVQARLCSRS